MTYDDPRLAVVYDIDNPDGPDQTSSDGSQTTSAPSASSILVAAPACSP